MIGGFRQSHDRRSAKVLSASLRRFGGVRCGSQGSQKKGEIWGPTHRRRLRLSSRWLWCSRCSSLRYVRTCYRNDGGDEARQSSSSARSGAHALSSSEERPADGGTAGPARAVGEVSGGNRKESESAYAARTGLSPRRRRSLDRPSRLFPSLSRRSLASKRAMRSRISGLNA